MKHEHLALAVKFYACFGKIQWVICSTEEAGVQDPRSPPKSELQNQSLDPESFWIFEHDAPCFVVN